MSLAESLAFTFLATLQMRGIAERDLYLQMEPWTKEPTGPEFGYMLRVASEDGKSSGFIERNIELDEPEEGFKWPTSGYVVAEVHGPFWGFYGLLDGVGNWNHLPRFKNATWQVVVVKRDECKDDPMGGAVRAPRCWVKYSGDAVGAMQLMIPYMVSRIKDGDPKELFPNRMNWVDMVYNARKP
ncbi:MAG: hypothetical protein ACT4OK_13030 [Gemmobacter sp.]